MEFGIHVVAIHDLLAAAEVDGFVASDGRTIYVDEGVYSHHLLYRYRFTLAHELAHVVLHLPLLSVARYRSIEEWRAFQADLSEQDRRWFEWQAYAFAGLVLVPQEALSVRIQDAIDRAKESGLVVDLANEADRRYIAEWIGRRFEVSGDVILRRGAKDGFWEEASR